MAHLIYKGCHSEAIKKHQPAYIEGNIDSVMQIAGNAKMVEVVEEVENQNCEEIPISLLMPPI